MKDGKDPRGWGLLDLQKSRAPGFLLAAVQCESSQRRLGLDINVLSAAKSFISKQAEHN